MLRDFQRSLLVPLLSVISACAASRAAGGVNDGGVVSIQVDNDLAPGTTVPISAVTSPEGDHSRAAAFTLPSQGRSTVLMKEECHRVIR